MGVGTKKLVLIEPGEAMADNYRILISGALILVFLVIALIDSATDSSSPQGRYRVPARVVLGRRAFRYSPFCGKPKRCNNRPTARGRLRVSGYF